MALEQSESSSCPQGQLFSPWSDPADPELLFPLPPYEKLLAHLGWPDHQAWLAHWQSRGGSALKRTFWHPATRRDWIWGLGLPLLTLVEHCLEARSFSLLGISGLPGSGKTSLGKWLEAAACELDLPLSVVSLDDFYWPASELDKAMRGNPWAVPRALPGSHDLALISKSLDDWLLDGTFYAPQFDKSKRAGRGDRQGWRRTKPRVLVLEGWFLGCQPSRDTCFTNSPDEHLRPPLTQQEIDYRPFVKEALEAYLPLWKRLDQLWQLRPLDFNSTCLWKAEQEASMQLEAGVSLASKELDGFVRMILAAIPHSCFQAIAADVVADLTPSRQLKRIGLRSLAI